MIEPHPPPGFRPKGISRFLRSTVYRRLCLPLIFLLFAVMVQPQSALADNHQSPTDVREIDVSVYLIDIDAIDSIAQSFTVNFFMMFSWQDPSLAHAGTDSIRLKLEDIWYPSIQILNQQNVSRTFPELAEVRPDGRVIYRQRIWGNLSQPLELRSFPFDSQVMEIIFVAVDFGSTPLKLVAGDRSDISESLKMPDWAITGWDFEAVDLPLGHKGTERPGLIFSVDVKRNTAFFILKVIFPLLLIVAMSWIVFWLDTGLAAPRISVAVTAMLTLIAYRFAIGSMVPRLPFLTSLDFFVLASSVLVFLSLVTVTYTTRLANTGNKEKAESIDRKARWIAPLLYALLILETLTFRHLG